MLKKKKRNVDYGLGTWSPSTDSRSPPTHHTVKVKTNVATRQVALSTAIPGPCYREILEPPRSWQSISGEGVALELIGTDLGQNGEVRQYLLDSAYRASSFPPRCSRLLGTTQCAIDTIFLSAVHPQIFSVFLSYNALLSKACALRSLSCYALVYFHKVSLD